MYFVLACVLSHALALAILAQPVIRSGSEFQVNSYTTNDQRRSDVASLTNGDFVVVWTSQNQDGDLKGIFGRRLDSTGAFQGPEFQLNAHTARGQYFSVVAPDASGGFVVAWTSNQQDGLGNDEGDGYRGVFGGRFDSAGTPMGQQFMVNSFTVGPQMYPAIDTDGEGDFVVVWRSWDQDGSNFGIFGRRFASSGSPLAAEFQVNTYTNNGQYAPDVAVDPAGGFIVVWSSIGQEGNNNFGIFGRRFDSSGAPAGPEFHVNTYVTNFQSYPAIAVDGAGGFVVVWTSIGQPSTTLYSVIGRRFDAAGGAIGGEFMINSNTTSDNYSAAIAMDDDGQFVVSWQSNLQDGSLLGVFARRFDSLGQPLGVELQINTYVTGNQFLPAVESDGAGSFLAHLE